MSFARSRLVQDKKDKRENFGAFIEEIFHRITSSKSVKFHVIFDSYIQGSIKGPERLRRNEGGALHLAAVRDIVGSYVLNVLLNHNALNVRKN